MDCRSINEASVEPDVQHNAPAATANEAAPPSTAVTSCNKLLRQCPPYGEKGYAVQGQQSYVEISPHRLVAVKRSGILDVRPCTQRAIIAARKPADQTEGLHHRCMLLMSTLLWFGPPLRESSSTETETAGVGVGVCGIRYGHTSRRLRLIYCCTSLMHTRSVSLW